MQCRFRVYGEGRVLAEHVGKVLDKDDIRTINRMGADLKRDEEGKPARLAFGPPPPDTLSPRIKHSARSVPRVGSVRVAGSTACTSGTSSQRSGDLRRWPGRQRPVTALGRRDRGFRSPTVILAERYSPFSQGLDLTAPYRSPGCCLG